MKVREKKWIRFRIYLVAFFFLSGMGIILARAYQFQVLERDRLATIADSAIRGVVKLPPKRGTIYDREGHELAVTVEMDSVFAHPRLVEKKLLTAKELSKILDVDQNHILDLLRSNRPFVWIERRIPPERVSRVKALGLQGIGVAKEARRYYPGKEIAAQVIGFAGGDNQGLEGLEKTYDSALRGPEEVLVQMVDALRRPFFITRPAAKGGEIHKLILTIDKDIQYKAQAVLKEAVEKTRAKGGHCIVVDPRTGEVLAMAVVPFFNPNVFWQHQPLQWRNRTITDLYEPGSTVKAFLLAAALETGTVTPETRIYCEKGQYQVGKHIINDHDAEGYGHLTVAEVITHSSNIGAVKIGQKLGYQRVHEYLHRFGFGKETEIDLPGERKGFVRPVKGSRPIDQATVSFGQGMTVNSLQLVMATAAIANAGKLMRPYVVKAVKDQQDRTVQEFRPRVVREVVSEETAKKTAEILEGVVSERGTAKRAAIPGYRVAGKTGTSQKVDPQTRAYSKRDYVAIFTGFVPASDPRLAILILVDEPRGEYYGGTVSAPVFAQVGAWALNHMRINPELKVVKLETSKEEPRPAEQEINQRPVVCEKEEGVLPDFRGLTMRQVLKEGNALGLNVVMEGTGLAVRQEPEPGSSLDEVTMLKVSFMPPM